jgi:hypothetical protein
LLTFALAQEDTKKMERRYSDSNGSNVSAQVTTPKNDVTNHNSTVVFISPSFPIIIPR